MASIRGAKRNSINYAVNTAIGNRNYQKSFLDDDKSSGFAKTPLPMSPREIKVDEPRRTNS